MQISQSRVLLSYRVQKFGIDFNANATKVPNQLSDLIGGSRAFHRPFLSSVPSPSLCLLRDESLYRDYGFSPSLKLFSKTVPDKRKCTNTKSNRIFKKFPSYCLQFFLLQRNLKKKEITKKRTLCHLRKLMYLSGHIKC